MPSSDDALLRALLAAYGSARSDRLSAYTSWEYALDLLESSVSLNRRAAGAYVLHILRRVMGHRSTYRRPMASSWGELQGLLGRWGHGEGRLWELP